MSQTLTSLLVHLVFSTKNREPLITPDVEPNLFAYIGGILGNNQSRLLDAGGDRDHVHLLISQSKNLALSNLLKEVKGDSSFWMNHKDQSFDSSIGRMVTAHSLLENPICRRFKNMSPPRKITIRNKRSKRN
jgi:putative transposase